MLPSSTLDRRTAKNSPSTYTVESAPANTTGERMGEYGSPARKLFLPQKLWDVIATWEAAGYRVQHHTPTDDTVYLTGGIREIINTLRLTHELKVIGWLPRLHGESATVMFSTGHVIQLRRERSSSDTYVRVWVSVYQDYETCRDVML